MDEYLKMADVFFDGVESDGNFPFIRDSTGYDMAWISHATCGDRNKAAKYAAHAINSHDELVAEVERLRGAIHDAFIDGCQVGWDMTGEGYNAEYGGPGDDRLHDEFAALFVERCADK